MTKSKNRQKDLDYEVRKRKIFLIVFEKTNCVFVNVTCQKSMLKLYEEHYREKYSATKQAFLDSKQAGITPPIYLLEEIEGTNSDAFRHIISWFRYFSQEHGYDCLASKKVMQIVETAEDSAHFQSIKRIPLEAICAPEKDLFPNFGAKKRRDNDEKRPSNGQRNLTISLSDERYQMVKKLSQQENISMKEFLVNCVDEKAGIGLVHSVQMEEYLQLSRQYFHTMNALLWEFQGLTDAILCTKDYDIEYLRSMDMMCRSMHKSNDRTKKAFLQLCQQLRRMKKWND